MCASKGKKTGLTGDLQLALSDMNARKRILEVNQRDKRTLSAIDQKFRDLDRLVNFLVKHLDDPVPIDVPAAPTRKRHDTDMDIALNPLMAEHEQENDASASGALEVQVPSASPTGAAPSSLPEPPLPDRETNNGVPEANPVKSPKRSWQRPPRFKTVDKVQILLRDVNWLLEIKDGEGMLISLERLLVAHEVQGELASFVRDNETKLMNVYESYLGPFTRVVQRLEKGADHPMPNAFLRARKISTVLDIIEEEAVSLETLLAVTPYSSLETCCIVSQLRRVGLVSIH